MGEEKWGVYQIVIAVVMVTTGSINTIAAKWADKLKANSTAGGETKEEERAFDHPFLQAVCMFIGEFSCLGAYGLFALYTYYQRRKRSRSEIARDLGPVDSSSEGAASDVPLWPKVNPLIFLPPAMCDMTATSLMYIGLNLTNAASFQMLRGAVIIFTGLLSVCVLRTRLRCFKWLGMLIVVGGLAVVGISDIIFGEKKEDGGQSSTTNAIVGDAIIVLAQVIVACQMVWEQKFIQKYNIPPLVAVGLEGFWGGTVLSILLIPFYYIRVPTKPIPFSSDPMGRLENVWDAFEQMNDNKLIIVALLGTVFSIAFFNFAGISVSKDLSATTRMVLDTVRTIVIWAFSLGLQWQKFIPLMIVGFSLLLSGMCVYNDLLFGPLFRRFALPRLEAWGCPRFFFCGCLPSEEEEERLISHATFQEPQEPQDVEA